MVLQDIMGQNRDRFLGGEWKVDIELISKETRAEEHCGWTLLSPALSTEAEECQATPVWKLQDSRAKWHNVMFPV